jgi:hypothetical protein
MLDYPAAILSYDFFAEDVPDPVQLVQSSGKMVLGGVDQDRLKTDFDGVVQRCVQYKTLRNWIVGPSCVVPVDTPEELIRKFLSAAVPQLRG